jgi:hypothetical protein
LEQFIELLRIHERLRVIVEAANELTTSGANQLLED